MLAVRQRPLYCLLKIGPRSVTPHHLKGLNLDLRIAVRAPDVEVRRRVIIGIDVEGQLAVPEDARHRPLLQEYKHSARRAPIQSRSASRASL